jgi:hypothetical protein
MKWTKEMPTVSGYYWVKTDDSRAEVVRVDLDIPQVETEWSETEPLVYVEGRMGEIGMDQFVTDRGSSLRWYGPLLPPECF